jgi:hypothetical protein
MLLDLISYNEVSDSLLKRKRNCFCFCFFDNAYFDSFIVSILVDIFSIMFLLCTKDWIVKEEIIVVSGILFFLSYYKVNCVCIPDHTRIWTVWV